MNLPFQPTLNSILMILIGLALIVFGIWLGTQASVRIYAVGFLLTGIGNILFGMTNGFIDLTPTGRLLYRIALAAYIIGVPLIAYFLYRQLES